MSGIKKSYHTDLVVLFPGPSREIRASGRNIVISFGPVIVLVSYRFRSCLSLTCPDKVTVLTMETFQNTIVFAVQALD